MANKKETKGQVCYSSFFEKPSAGHAIQRVRPKNSTVISALQAATLFEADFKYRPQIGRRDINTGRI